MEDYATFKASEYSGRPVINFVDADGQISNDFETVAAATGATRLIGKQVLKDAPEEILDILKEKGLLVAEAKLRHKYPYDWKTKQPVIVRSTQQWFASIDQIKEQAIQALQDVNFVPEAGI